VACLWSGGRTGKVPGSKGAAFLLTCYGEAGRALSESDTGVLRESSHAPAVSQNGRAGQAYFQRDGQAATGFRERGAIFAEGCVMAIENPGRGAGDGSCSYREGRTALQCGWRDSSTPESNGGKCEGTGGS